MADEEAPTTSDQESYYAVLNVPRDASAESIKKAYRQLAQVCHPDKAPDSVSSSGAASNFMRIQEAYEVLSNEEKRTVYDVYGKQGLEAGMELGECLRTPDQLKKDYQNFQAQRKAEKREASVAHRGAYIFKVDACETMNPYDPEVDHTPELISVATTNSVQIPLSENTAASVGCQVAVRKKVGGGSFVCGLKRVLTPNDILECHAAIGLKTFVSSTVTRHLGEHTTASLTSSWHPQAGLSLSMSTSRQLTPSTEADLVTQFGPDSMVGVGVTHQGRKILISARLEAGASTGVVGKVVWQATASMSLRASAKLGTMGVEVELGGSHRVSEFSTAGCSVVAGLQGLILRPRFSRGGHVFEVPVMLSPSVQQDTNLVIAAYVVPPLLTFITKYYVVLPLQKRSKVKKLMKARLARVAEVRSALEEATAAAAILEPVAMRKLRQEAKKGGLVILSAKYGAAQAVKLAEEAEAWGAERSSESSTSGQDKAPPQPADTSRFTPRCDGEGADSDSDVAARVDKAVSSAVADLPPAWLDVSSALRFQVKDSRVQFHKGLSKSGLMGFCDVALGEEKVLLVHYYFHNRPHTATIPDRAGQSLPEDGTLVTCDDHVARLQRLADGLRIPTAPE